MLPHSIADPPRKKFRPPPIPTPDRRAFLTWLWAYGIDQPPGDPPKYNIHQFDPAKAKGGLYFAVSRVSYRTQDHAGNLADSQSSISQFIEGIGGNLAPGITHVGSGIDPCWLADKVVPHARKHGAMPVFETTDRICRSDAYHSEKRPYAQANDGDLLSMRCVAGWEVKFLTISDPKDTPGDMRGHQTKRGMKEKGAMGGRPAKVERFNPPPPWNKAYSEEWQPVAVRMYTGGLTTAEIESEISCLSNRRVTRTTVNNWLKRAGLTLSRTGQN